MPTGDTFPYWEAVDRKSTRLNSSHVKISYAVFCLKKKNEIAALAASERRDADLDRLFAALSTMRFFFNDTATTEIYTLSLHDALPIFS